MANAKLDQNSRPTLTAMSSANDGTIVQLWADPTLHALLTTTSGGSGTVTDVSVVSANGFAGSVATSTTTPAITLSTTVTGILKGNGTAISAGVAGDVDSILPTQTGHNGEFLTTNGTVSSWAAVAGSGTVTDVSVVTANGVSGSVATSTTTPAITLTLGAITPTTVVASDPTTPAISTATGKTNTGYVQVNGKTSGALKITAADATAQVVTLTTAAQTVGAATLTIPDMANTSKTVAWLESPSFTTPSLGVATATSINKVAITAPATSATLTIADGKTLTVSNTLTFTGTDSSSVAFGTGGTVLYTASAIPLTVGTTTIASGTTTKVLYDNAGVLGEYTISGSGNVAMTTSPVFTTPTLGVASATTVNKVALTAPATGSTLTIADGKTLTASNTLTLAGTDSTTMTFPSTSATIARTDAANTFTGIQTITNITLPTNGQILLTVPSTDGHATGPTTSSFVSGYTSSAVGDLVYLDSSAKWQKADADAASTASNLLGIALAVAATDAALLVALPGSMVYATAFPTLTIGAPYYVGETAGAIQATIPTGADNVIRTVGYGVHADKLFFLPASIVQVTVA